MGILSIPSRGQPLDVTYISQIASQVNKLTSIVGDKISSFSSINDFSQKTSDLKIYAKTVNVFASTNKTDGDVVDYTVNYPTFNGIPVVTATIVAGSASNIGDNATIVLKSVTTSSATFRVTFYSGGNLDISVNIVAIGFPTSS
jgi:hypothetical protein